MRDLWEIGILQRIAVLVLVTILLGISPLPHLVANEARLVGRTRQFNLPVGTARNLALVAENQPWRSNLWEQAGSFAFTAAAPETAIAYFKEAAARGALSQEGYLQFGDAYQQSGNLFTARQIWETAGYIYGPSPETLTRLAQAQRQTEDYLALIDTLKQLSSLPSAGSNQPADKVGTYYELGMLLAVQDPASAPPYLLQAAELDPALKDASELAFTIQRALPQGNPAYTLMSAGRKMADQGKWKLAAYAFQQITASQPGYGEAWAYLGETLQHLEDPANQEAYPALAKALEIDPTSLPANTFMALYWQRAGDPERSLEYLSVAAQIDPTNPDILVDLGAGEAIAGDLEAATQYYWQAIELTSRDPEYLRKFVNFCIQYNLDLQEIALPVARELVQAGQDEPESLDVMGQLLFRLGDLYNAERFLLRATSLDPQYAPAYLHLGLVYSLQGKTSLAHEAFARAIILAPGTQTAILAERFYSGSSNP